MFVQRSQKGSSNPVEKVNFKKVFMFVWKSKVREPQYKAREKAMCLMWLFNYFKLAGLFYISQGMLNAGLFSRLKTDIIMKK